MLRLIWMIFLISAGSVCSQSFRTAYLDTSHQVQQFEQSISTECPVQIETNFKGQRIPSFYPEIICLKTEGCTQLIDRLETRLILKDGSTKIKFVDQRVGCAPFQSTIKSKAAKSMPRRNWATSSTIKWFSRTWNYSSRTCNFGTNYLFRIFAK